jgi:hypothetical protein
MDYYTVIFLNLANGNRCIIEGVNAQIEVEKGFSESGKKIHFKKPKNNPSNLDITLEFNTATKGKLDQLREQIMFSELLLWFKDTHPNLIRGFVKGIEVNQHLVTIKFKGYVTDKTYLDFVTEVTNGLKSEQNIITLSEDSINNSIIHLPEHENKRKNSVQELKRKLTFK